jgi:hypothetical protein
MTRVRSWLFGVELLGWALWVGGLVTVALAAPLIFQTIQSRDVAGRVFGAILGRFFLVLYVAAGAQLLAGLLHSRGAWVKHGLVAVVLGIAVYTNLVVMGEMTQIQATLPGPIETLPVGEGPRARFDALHKLSERLMGVAAMLGLVLLPLLVATRPSRLPLEVQPGDVVRRQVDRERAQAVV